MCTKLRGWSVSFGNFFPWSQSIEVVTSEKCQIMTPGPSSAKQTCWSGAKLFTSVTSGSSSVKQHVLRARNPWPKWLKWRGRCYFCVFGSAKWGRKSWYDKSRTHLFPHMTSTQKIPKWEFGSSLPSRDNMWRALWLPPLQRSAFHFPHFSLCMSSTLPSSLPESSTFTSLELNDIL